MKMKKNAMTVSRTLSSVAVMMVLMSGEAQAVSLSSGLVGYWQFNDTGADVSGNGRDVSLFGGAGFGPGLFGQALSLDGTLGMGAQRPSDDAAFNFASGDFTIQLWANLATTSSGEQTLIEKFTGGGGPGWTLTTPGVTQFYAAPAIVLNSGSMTFPVGGWQQFVVRRSGSLFNVFHDDTLVATGTSAGSLPISANPLLIGARNTGDGRNFTVNGLMDEVAIWNRALSDTDLALIWNGGAGRQITSAVDGGTIAPSSSTAGGVDPIGKITIDGDVTFRNSAKYLADLDLAGLKSDYLGVDGTLNLGTDSLLDLNLINDLLLDAGKEFQIVGYGGSDGNYFKGFGDGYRFNRGRNRWEIDYRPGGIYLTSLGAAAVPEPASLALLLLAAGLLVVRRRSL
ncbi:MAG: LamG domain-containing protein [Candidatus Accumulibacter phosphatis]|uniref:LamG domain-containing protein n=1 Tax=Candidatus Accumulibacter phosphatis TaxID=327160 RepID=UPI001A4334E6|nr:LamG domain-containing protein [Candidatus Accumulibacter phosphatis]